MENKIHSHKNTHSQRKRKLQLENCYSLKMFEVRLNNNNCTRTSIEPLQKSVDFFWECAVLDAYVFTLVTSKLEFFFALFIHFSSVFIGSRVGLQLQYYVFFDFTIGNSQTNQKCLFLHLAVCSIRLWRCEWIFHCFDRLLWHSFSFRVRAS